MLEYIADMSDELAKRRETMIKNMRSGSSSFYPSYRSLCEEFVRYALALGGKEISSKDKIGAVMSSDDTLRYFTSRGCSERSYEKIRDLIAKINKQVHRYEKEFDTDLAVVYINALFDFTSPFAGTSVLRPNAEEIEQICFAHEKEIDAVVKEGEVKSERMLDELKDYIDERFNNIESVIKTKSPSPRKALADGRVSPPRETKYLTYILGGSFEKRRLIAILLAISIVPLAIVTTFLSVEISSVYSTFICVQHVWHIMSIVLAFKLSLLDRTVDLEWFNDKMPAETDMIDNSWLPVSINSKYKVFLVFYIIGVVLDITSASVSWSESKGNGTSYLLTLLIILYCISVAASVALRILTSRILMSYIGIITRYQVKTEEGISILTTCRVLNITYTEAEFCKKFLSGDPIIYPVKKIQKHSKKERG